MKATNANKFCRSKSILRIQLVSYSCPLPRCIYTPRLRHRMRTTRLGLVPSGSSVVWPAVATSFSVTAERGRGVPTFDTTALRVCPSDACGPWSFPPPSLPRARNHACRATVRLPHGILVRPARCLTRSRGVSVSLRAIFSRNARMILRQQLEHNGVVSTTALTGSRFRFSSFEIGNIYLRVLLSVSLL